jgi:hypothetical protein
MFTPEVQDTIMQEVLFDSYETVLECTVENHEKDSYVPIYSYERCEENEKLTELKNAMEIVNEWYIGHNWREKFKHSVD